MTWSPEIDLQFGGDVHKFALWNKQLRALSATFGQGPFGLFRQLQSDGDVYVNVPGRTKSLVEEILRLGLEGGGMSSAEVASMMERHGTDQQSPFVLNLHAKAVMTAAIMDMSAKEDDDEGKAEAADSETTT